MGILLCSLSENTHRVMEELHFHTTPFIGNCGSDYQDYDDCLMLEKEYLNLLSEWTFFDFLIFPKKEDVDLYDRIQDVCEKHMRKFEEENERYKELNERMSVF